MKFIKKHGKGTVNSGSAIVLVLFIIVLLSIIGVGLLNLSYGARLNAIRMKNETVATLSAEAGYEKAVFWMAQQDDMLYKMKSDGSYTDSFVFDNSTCTYTVRFNSFIGSRPIYKITSISDVGQAQRAVEVLVAQEIGGWDMGMCRVPDDKGKYNNGTYGTTTNTTPVNFADKEEFDTPIHINSYGNDKFDTEIDIHILGKPKFLRPVSMSESRTSSGGADKYSGVVNCFRAGIDFLQPDSQITNEDIIEDKVEKFADNTKNDYKFTPVASNSVPAPRSAAVQLEFYVVNGVGKIRITNNCTVAGKYGGRYDYKIQPDTGGKTYEKYPIYKYHYSKNGEPKNVINVEDTYVTQTVGGVSSAPGGQIYVNGNVVIGGNMPDHQGNQLVKGTITVVATGNIWIADSILVDGDHDASNNKVPSPDNPNAIGLIAQGVIKIIDPGLSDSFSSLTEIDGFAYERVGRPRAGKQRLFEHVEIEAAVTVGGGGFGAENVGARKEWSSNDQDYLYLRGVISESVRGIVGLVSTPKDGFIKHYYVDERMLQGILPGDMWLKRKYIPTAAGWSDYRP
jgi:hypothetical protein